MKKKKIQKNKEVIIKEEMDELRKRFIELREKHKQEMRELRAWIRQSKEAMELIISQAVNRIDEKIDSETQRRIWLYLPEIVEDEIKKGGYVTPEKWAKYIKVNFVERLLDLEAKVNEIENGD